MPAQTYVDRRPPAGLAELVSTLWVQKIGADSGPCQHRNIPNGSVEIHCRIGMTPKVIGPRTTPSVETLPAGTTVVGARLRPGAAATVLCIAAHEAIGLAFDLTDLPGGAARNSAERLGDARSPEEAVRILQQALLTTSSQTIDPVVSETVSRLERSGHGGLRAIRSELFLSERHFRRRIREAVGVAPKVLEGTLRFQRLLATMQFMQARGESPAELGLAELAAAHGYADESHLNRECRRLTGLSISGFLADVDRTCGCGHDHSASYSRYLGEASPARG